MDGWKVQIMESVGEEIWGVSGVVDYPLLRLINSLVRQRVVLFRVGISFHWCLELTETKQNSLCHMTAFGECINYFHPEKCRILRERDGWCSDLHLLLPNTPPPPPQSFTVQHGITIDTHPLHMYPTNAKTTTSQSTYRALISLHISPHFAMPRPPTWFFGGFFGGGYISQ